jgi:hypothetical protein
MLLQFTQAIPSSGDRVSFAGPELGRILDFGFSILAKNDLRPFGTPKSTIKNPESAGAMSLGDPLSQSKGKQAGRIATASGQMEIALGPFSSHLAPVPRFAAGSPPRATAPEIEITDRSGLQSFHYHLERRVLDRVGGTFARKAYDLRIDFGGSADAFEKLREYFSPERTAERIARFVMGGFSSGERRAFVDGILPYVRQGVDEALALFAPFDEVVRPPAEETYSLVKEKLDAFARGETSVKP